MPEPVASIRNIAEVGWEELPGHHGSAFSKLLAYPDTTGSCHLDHRISAYQPRAYVEPYGQKVQEQVYHMLEGEGLMEIDTIKRVVRRHDVIFHSTWSTPCRL